MYSARMSILKRFFWQKRLDFFFPAVFQNRQNDLFFSKEATSQNKAFCTTPQWNSFFFLFCFLFLFSSPFRFIWYGDKLEHDPFGIFPNRSDKHFQPTLATNLLTCTNVCRQAFLQCRATCQTIKMPCSRQSSGWSVGVEFASPNISNWSDKAARLHANTDWCW